jgi:hypothetical protein
MEVKYDSRYCPQCYQFGKTGGDAQACRACFGNRAGNSETSFESAFILMADVDGRTGEAASGTTWQALEETAGPTYAEGPDSLHTG